jgi:hypothetical protein
MSCFLLHPARLRSNSILESRNHSKIVVAGWTTFQNLWLCGSDRNQKKFHIFMGSGDAALDIFRFCDFQEPASGRPVQVRLSMWISALSAEAGCLRWPNAFPSLLRAVMAGKRHAKPAPPGRRKSSCAGQCAGSGKGCICASGGGMAGFGGRCVYRRHEGRYHSQRHVPLLR